MIIGSIKENLSLEKRVSITPETAKNIINLGLKICIETDYATHIGIKDEDYKNAGAEMKNSSKEVLKVSGLPSASYYILLQNQGSIITRTFTLQ